MAKSQFHSYYRNLVEKRDIGNDKNEKEFGEDRLVGINIIPNVETQESAPYLTDIEFEQCAREISEYADYLLLDISNAKNDAISQYKSDKKLGDLIKKIKRLRTLETGYQAAYDYETKVILKNKVVEQSTIENNAFHSIFNHYEKNNPLTQKKTPLLFVKIDANLTKEELGRVAKVALSEGLDGIVVGSCSSGTSSSRGDVQKELIGGKPNKEKANEALKSLYQLTQGNFIYLKIRINIFPKKELLYFPH